MSFDETTTLADVLASTTSVVESFKPVIREKLGEAMDFSLAMAFSNGKPTAVDLLEIAEEAGGEDGTALSAVDRAVVKSFIGVCAKWTSATFKKQKIRSEVGKYADIGAPSTFGKPSAWSKYQKGEEEKGPEGKAIRCGRPNDISWLNIQIMHPIFHELATLIDSGEPTTADYLFAAELCLHMPGAFVVENDRRDTINRIFNKHLGAAIGVHCIASQFDTDGTWVEAGTNVEYKNEKGKGDSDPYMQNAAYYIHYWAHNDSGPKRHCCPWILVEVLGQEIGMSGAVWACGEPCIQPISSNIPFLGAPADKRMSLQRARLCMALRHGVQSLSKFYSGDDITKLDPQAMFPYPRCFNYTPEGGGEQEIRFQYESPVFPGQKMLFACSAIVQGSQRQLLVKFTDQYSAEAHRVAANAGLAPKLYTVVEVSGLLMVVMEPIHNSHSWSSRGKESEASCLALQKFLTVYRDKGLVHGDLRAPNILVSNDDGCVRVVDFDWAGHHNFSMYPKPVNPEEKWANGVQVGNVMMMEHDEFMVRRLLNTNKEITN